MVMRIKELRVAANMTQEQLAAGMGVEQNSVSNWENENYLPRTRQLPTLARLLNCSINDLFVSAEAEAV